MWTIQLTLLLVAPFLAFGNQSQPRIMNGNHLLIHEAPYMAAMVSMDPCAGGDKEHVFGTGVILSERFVLTVAHIWNYDADDLDADFNTKECSVIRYGCSTVMLGEGSTAFIAHIMIHSRYPGFDDLASSQYDVAVLKTEASLELRVNYAVPMSIANPREDYDNGTNCMVFGYGSTGYATLDLTSSRLRATPLKIRHLEDCRRYFPVGPGEICGYGDDNSGPCPGDSGGPLFCNGHMYAIHNIGRQYCFPFATETVGLYIPLSPLERFIRQSTRNTALWDLYLG